MPNEKFVNPYTFIGLGKKKSSGGGKGKLTGVLHCNLKTLTPLIIPSAANEDAFPAIADDIVAKWNEREPDKKIKREDIRSYDFFSYDNPAGNREGIESKPVIPGSSIRGMIRSIYETLTDSCLSSIDEDMVLNKRSVIPYDRDRDNPNMGVGIVEKVGDKWVLKKGKKALLPVDRVDGFRPVFEPGTKTPKFKLFSRRSLPRWGTKIYIKFGGAYGRNKNLEYPVVSDISQASSNNRDEKVAYHLPGYKFGDSNRKHFDTVVYDFENAKPFELTPDDIKRIKELETLYNETNAKDSAPYKGWANFKAGKPFPVYFENMGGVLYISPACISQEVFARKVGEMIGEFAPCNDSDNLCEACKLFGMVGKGGESGKINAVASKVSFRDATSQDAGQWYDQPKPLAILGQPRPSATEFYMKQPDVDAAIFNYDYYITHGERNTEKNRKHKLSSAEIKGRKFYWHSDNTATRYAKPTDRPDMSIIARAVKAQRSFELSVAFENLSEEELAKLIWVLTIGGKASSQDGNPTHGLKLGHGKPIGFGSIGINIDYGRSGVFLLDDNLNIALSELEVSEDFNIILGGETLPDVSKRLRHIPEFLRVSIWKDRHNNVMYPLCESKGTESVFAWFGANRRGLGNDFNPQFISTLPELSNTAHSQEMSLNPADSGNRGGQDYSPLPEKKDEGNKPMASLFSPVKPEVAKPAAPPAPKDKQINEAFTHLGKKFGRMKALDGKHLATLKAIPEGHPLYDKAQKVIKDYEGTT